MLYNKIVKRRFENVQNSMELVEGGIFKNVR